MPKVSAQKNRACSARFLKDLLLGGVFLGGAGDGMLLMGHHGLDQLHGAAQTQIAGIQAEVVAAHRAPLLGGMRLFWPLRLRAAITPAL